MRDWHFLEASLLASREPSDETGLYECQKSRSWDGLERLTFIRRESRCKERGLVSYESIGIHIPWKTAMVARKRRMWPSIVSESCQWFKRQWQRSSTWYSSLQVYLSGHGISNTSAPPSKDRSSKCFFSDTLQDWRGNKQVLDFNTCHFMAYRTGRHNSIY